MTPDPPTAKHVEELGQLTPMKNLVVSPVTDHSVPPLVVTSIPPSPDVATQNEVLAQLMPKMPFVVVELWPPQWAPPSVVTRMRPPSPPPKHTLTAGQLSDSSMVMLY